MRDELFQGAFALSTADRYEGVWRDFVHVMLGLGVDEAGAATPEYVSLYAAYLYSRGLKYNTITSYLTALAHGFKSRYLLSVLSQVMTLCWPELCLYGLMLLPCGCLKWLSGQRVIML